MSREATPIDDDDPIEAALRGLAPSPSRIDRELVLGHATKSRSRRPDPWRLVAAAMAMVAAGEAVLLATRPAERVVERVVYLDRTAPATPVAANPAPLSPLPTPPPIRSAPRWDPFGVALAGRPDWGRLGGRDLVEGLDSPPARTVRDDTPPRALPTLRALREELERGDPS